MDYNIIQSNDTILEIEYSGMEAVSTYPHELNKQDKKVTPEAGVHVLQEMIEMAFH